MDEFKKYTTEYLDYLEDIRQRVYRLIVVFLAFFAIGFFLTTPLLKIFINLLQIKDVKIITTSPFQTIDLAMSIGISFAIIAILPMVIFQAYSFLKSGLLKRERRFFFMLLPISLLLFVIGFSYGFATLYYALQVIAGINLTLGVVNLWDISKFISQIVLTSALLGTIFQFPIILTFLMNIGVMSIKILESKRRHAIAAIFIFVSLLPPTDGLSLIVMSLPLIAIYELTIFFNSYRKYY
jgi:sec-independent protein translocase protein TatC